MYCLFQDFTKLAAMQVFILTFFPQLLVRQESANNGVGRIIEMGEWKYENLVS